MASSNGTLIFTPDASRNLADYNPAYFERIALAENRHFWFKARRRTILRLFQAYVRKGARVIEVGAGTGNVARALASHGYNVAVGDVFVEAMEHARIAGITERYQFDVARAPFRDHFDAVALFDVLEHIEDDETAVLNVHRMLRRRGHAVVTVPAHRLLWCQSDVVAGHKRRYDTRRIVRLFRACGFEVLEVRSLFVLILPLLLMRALLYRPSASGGSEAAVPELRVVPIVNDLLAGMMAIENGLLRSFPPGIGGSLALVARRCG